MFAGFIGYPLLGYWLSKKKFTISEQKMCILGFITLIVSLAVFVYCGYSKLDFLSPRYLNIANMFMGVGMFVFIKYMDELNLFSRVKDTFIAKAIISLSLCSYGMYFSHVLVVKELSYHNPGSNLLFPTMFAAIVFLSWLLPYLLSKIPYLKTVSGV